MGGRPSVPALPVPFTDGPRPGVLASASRVPASARDQRPLPGCACPARAQIYADDYWAAWGKIYVVATGTVGVVVALVWSGAAALVVALGLAAIGALATATSAGWRCTDCQRWIQPAGLDDAQGRDRRRRTIGFAVLGALLAVGCEAAVRAWDASMVLTPPDQLWGGTEE